MSIQIRQILILTNDEIKASFPDIDLYSPDACTAIIGLQNLRRIPIVARITIRGIDQAKHIRPGEIAIFNDGTMTIDEARWSGLETNAKWRFGCAAFEADENGRPGRSIAHLTICGEGTDPLRIDCNDEGIILHDH